MRKLNTLLKISLNQVVNEKWTKLKKKLLLVVRREATPEEVAKQFSCLHANTNEKSIRFIHLKQVLPHTCQCLCKYGNSNQRNHFLLFKNNINTLCKKKRSIKLNFIMKIFTNWSIYWHLALRWGVSIVHFLLINNYLG